MSTFEANFRATSNRIPDPAYILAVKSEVFYEYDNKHRAVNMSAPSHEEISVSSPPTNKPDYIRALFLERLEP